LGNTAGAARTGRRVPRREERAPRGKKAVVAKAIVAKDGRGRKAHDAPRRVRLPVDERRINLIELGIQLFSSRSYEDLSIDEVAAAAGISKGLLYHYFRSKQEFYAETIRVASMRLRRLTEPDPKLPPYERLRAAIDAHLGFVKEHSLAYAAIYRSGVAVAPEVGEILEDHREAVMRSFLHDLRLRKPPAVLRAAIRGWIFMVEGACLDWIAHPELRREDLRELLVAGYAAMFAKALEIDPKSLRATK
jgi:AcrR family transcriptional regulator